MAKEEKGQFMAQLNEYFRVLPQDKLFAWIAIVIGFLLVMLALILW